MLRPWDAESEEEQQWDKIASEGIPVLASNSDDSIIFVAKKPLLLPIEWLQFVRRASMGALPTFSSLASDTSSSLGEYWLTIFIWLI